MRTETVEELFDQIRLIPLQSAKYNIYIDIIRHSKFPWTFQTYYNFFP